MSPIAAVASKQRSSKQGLPILTQTPDCGTSLLNWNQHAVTFTMNFFGDIYRFRRREDEDPDELAMRPENTMFVEYLPAGCFGPKMDQEKDIIGILDFRWEKVQGGVGGSYYQAKLPDKGHGIDLATINNLIARL